MGLKRYSIDIKGGDIMPRTVDDIFSDIDFNYKKCGGQSYSVCVHCGSKLSENQVKCPVCHLQKRAIILVPMFTTRAGS